MRLAEDGIIELQKHVDTLIVIPNQNLFRVANEKTTFADAFAMADQVLYSGVACITDLMVKEGLINLDFADVRAVMRGMGKAMMGTGEASGEKRAIEAAEAAIANPLLDDVSMQRRARPADLDHRRPRHDAVRGRRGGEPHPRGSRSPTPTSSSARPSTRASKASSASRWSRPASSSASAGAGAPPRRHGRADAPAEVAERRAAAGRAPAAQPGARAAHRRRMRSRLMQSAPEARPRAARAAAAAPVRPCRIRTVPTPRSGRARTPPGLRRRTTERRRANEARPPPAASSSRRRRAARRSCRRACPGSRTSRRRRSARCAPSRRAVRPAAEEQRRPRGLIARRLGPDAPRRGAGDEIGGRARDGDRAAQVVAGAGRTGADAGRSNSPSMPQPRRGEPRAPQGQLDQHGRPAPAGSRERGHLEIPAFLRRQSS